MRRHINEKAPTSTYTKKTWTMLHPRSKVLAGNLIQEM